MVAVHAWTYRGGGRTAEAVYAAHRRALEELLARAGCEQPGARVRLRLVEDDPVPALLAMSAGADMLVLGHHGHGWWVRALTGSVSAQCVRRASVPVVIVPAARARRRPLSDLDYQPGSIV